MELGQTECYTLTEQFNKLGGGILYYSNRTGVNHNFIIILRIMHGFGAQYRTFTRNSE